MPNQPGRGASWPPARARERRSTPVVLMAALAVVALAKLGLLVADIFGLTAAGSSLAEGPPTARVAGPIATADDAGPAPMPAAGPDPPAPPAAGSIAPEVPASPRAIAELPTAPAQDFDPSRLTASEIEVLQQLAARRTALDQRASELDRRQALLETAAAALEGQIAQLTELRDQIAKTVEQHDAAEEARIRSLVKIYETMKAKAAAEIFNRLEMPVLIRVVERMREPKSADVLARMDPVKAKQVTTELARRSKLLETAAGGGDGGAATPAKGG